MDTIKGYLDTMFANLPATDSVMRAKEELWGMMEDKYNELIRDGMSENEAVGTVITEFGNLNELTDILGLNDEVPGLSDANDDHVISPNDAENHTSNTHGKSREITYGNATIAAIMSVFWQTVSCLYLSISFITFSWSMTWIIWPIAAILHKLLQSMFREA
jgi:hypothetical protein